MALRPEEYPMKPQLVDIGKEIVQKCANVPLAIRVVGSFLRGQGESKWENLKNTDLANIKQDEKNGILPVLKISYNYLPFHLKCCFSYCAVFPKDYKIVKDDLIRLWMAQGFIMPSIGENFEDAGEEYFKQLLQRCFFQDVEKAEYTDKIKSCKMHDLVHDLAKEVAGLEILLCNNSKQCFTEKTCHVFLDSSTSKDPFDNLTVMKRTRTFLCEDGNFSDGMSLVEKILKMRCLRALRCCRQCWLNHGTRKLLASAIGQLLHLRYIDLSRNNNLIMLPLSITNLYNLQTLKLYMCWKLERLPRDLRKLVNLRHLDIYGCSSLTCMPPGMNSMKHLQNLTGYVVGGTSNNVEYRESAGVDELVNLVTFTSHSEILEIVVKQGVRYNDVEASEEGFLCNSQRLREFKYLCDISEDDGNDNGIKAMLQRLRPHSYLRRLGLWRYPGLRLPFWIMNLKTCLPNLVEIEIRECSRLEQLPLMSQLRHLKSLRLAKLDEVEYVESTSNNNSGDEDGDDGLVFFPSLEKLQLWDMPKLKGWWKSESESRKGETQEATVLSELVIRDCPELTTFPMCPKLEKLELINYNEAPDPIMRLTKIDELLRKLHSGNPDDQRTAAIDNWLLAKRNAHNRVTIAEAGAIPLLVDLLSALDLSTQEHAVTALLNLSLCDDNKGSIANSGAVPGIVHVLKKGSMEARENAAATLFSISVVDENKVTVGSSAAIPPLVMLLSEGTQRGKKYAATALFNLCIYQGNKVRAVRAGIVPTLMGLLTEPGAGMLDEALDILAVLASHPEGKAAIGSADALPFLVYVIANGSPRNKENAAAVLVHLCSGDPNYLAAAQEIGIMSQLLEMIQSSTKRG